MFWENFVYFCNQHGYSPNKVASILGFSTGTVTWWKKGRLPHDSTLLKIADFFQISTSDLLSEKTPTTQFKKNFENICNQKGISPTQACLNSGLSNAAYSQWREETVPRRTTLVKLAATLGVTVEELLGQKEIPRTDQGLSEEEQELIDLFRIVPADHQRMVLDIIHAAVGK